MLKTFVLSLDGTAQNLLTALTASAVTTTTGATENLHCVSLDLQPRGTNAAPVYIGDSSAVSSTNYGTRLEAGTAGVPPAPYPFGPYRAGSINLADIWVIGGAGEFLHCTAVPV